MLLFVWTYCRRIGAFPLEIRPIVRIVVQWPESGRLPVGGEVVHAVRRPVTQQTVQLTVFLFLSELT